MTGQVTHPDVARAKFDAELAAFAADEDQLRKRGVFLAKSDYPTVTVLFTLPHLIPSAVLFAMRIDYSDYDLQPPSVRFVHAFDDHELTAKELPTKLPRRQNTPLHAAIAQAMAEANAQAPAAGPELGTPEPQNADGVPHAPEPQLMVQADIPLLQDYGPDAIPFLCLPGIREYHDHPAHSGDLWELHRKEGAGALVRLVNIVCTYGVEPAAGWGFNFQINLGYGEPPA